MLKKDLRKMFREKRAALTASEKMKLDDLLLIQFQKIYLPQIDYALSFFPADDKHEPDTFPITRFLQFQHPGIAIAYPKTELFQKSMLAMVPESEEAFETNVLGINEPVKGNVVLPEDLDLVLIPMLAFDSKGNRVGYGKGFYDQFLVNCRPDCLKIGLSFFDAVAQIEDANAFDVPLNICVTPHRVYEF